METYMMLRIIYFALDTFCSFVSKARKKPYAPQIKSNDTTLLQKSSDVAKICLQKNQKEKFAKFNYQTTKKAFNKILYLHRQNYLAKVAKENQPKNLANMFQEQPKIPVASVRTFWCIYMLVYKVFTLKNRNFKFMKYLPDH